MPARRMGCLILRRVVMGVVITAWVKLVDYMGAWAGRRSGVHGGEDIFSVEFHDIDTLQLFDQSTSTQGIFVKFPLTRFYILESDTSLWPKTKIWLIMRGIFVRQTFPPVSPRATNDSIFIHEEGILF
jgi:hypothetical protein